MLNFIKTEQKRVKDQMNTIVSHPLFDFLLETTKTPSVSIP